jgi:signal transduction histidine kinase
VRFHPRRPPAFEELRRRVERLDKIPLRPLTARAVIGSSPDLPDDEASAALSPKTRSICQLDPGWMLAHSTGMGSAHPLTRIAETHWWPATVTAGPVADLIGRLWRHSVAVAVAARSLARDANDPDPDEVARAGLLCRLGCWAVMAVDPDWMTRWWNESTAPARRRRELTDLGTELDDLGRRTAERWGCDPLAIDAAWLHGRHGRALEGAASEPTRLAYVQEACRWAEQTPWSLEAGSTADGMPAEPRLKILVAEVQARTGSAFVAADATPQEERMTRQNARLRLLLAAACRDRDRGDRFLQALADCDPACSPEEWASRAALYWCAEPDVSAARVVWLDSARAVSAQDAMPLASAASAEERPPASSSNPRAPAVVIPLEPRGRTRALVHIWGDLVGPGVKDRLAAGAARGAWEYWAAMVADRAVADRRIQTVVRSLRDRIETEEERLRQQKLDALGEFAGGAGHELNNPLAVIVGRAQLLLARTDDPETARSIRIILNQAGRAHRILRDLMFVARPPAPRPRSGRPGDLLRACLRDLEGECAARGIHLASEIDDANPTASIDPDALRHLAEILLRNAIEATPADGKILVRSTAQGNELSWWFCDSGKGIAATEGAHLFDPFYCGRQAGRGLGLGLPRAARIVEQAGGRLRWTSNPGHGSVFHVHLPNALHADKGDQPQPIFAPLAGSRDRPPKN